ncbi:MULTISPECIES: hypothetical protein [Nocardia]|uniref:hypothetical protein n=1 Tax=Nocardia TaxID=1817 RepID=UPI001915B451|nr:MULTISPECIES: hypothetical protein [Nocardia]
MPAITSTHPTNYTVRDGGRDLYTIRSYGEPPARPSTSLPAWSATLSKFAVLRRDSEGFVLEHPTSWCVLRIHDPRLLALLDGLGAADSAVPIGVKAQFADDLHWGGFFVADSDPEEYTQDLTVRRGCRCTSSASSSHDIG